MTIARSLALDECACSNANTIALDGASVDTHATARLLGVGFYEFHPDRNINFQLNC